MDPLIPHFVDASIEKLRRLDMMSLPGKKSPEMLDPSIPPDHDWIGWKPIPSTVTDDDLDALQREIGLTYPPLYRDFLKYKHFYQLDAPFDFLPHPIHTWRDKLRETYRGWDPDRILKIGLIPFGDERLADAGPVCIDTRFRQNDGDCPIVIWDHEWVDTKKEIRPLFSSTRAMFRCLHFAASTDINFVYHDRGYDDKSLVPQKRKLLKEFLDFDPAGAGKEGREYWTGWGVKPD